MVVRRSQQFDREPSGLHPSGGIDSRTDLENDVVDRQMARFQFGQGGHGKKSLAWILIELLESEMSEYPVLPDHRNKVRCDADDQKVQKRNQRLERDAEFL